MYVYIYIYIYLFVYLYVYMCPLEGQAPCSQRPPAFDRNQLTGLSIISTAQMHRLTYGICDIYIYIYICLQRERCIDEHTYIHVCIYTQTQKMNVTIDEFPPPVGSGCRCFERIVEPPVGSKPSPETRTICILVLYIYIYIYI